MPSDHYIQNNSNFVKIINKILQNCNLTNWITLGITPNQPSTSYGYIKLKINSLKKNLFEVENFIENQTRQQQQNFLTLEVFVNSRIFIGNANRS